MSEQTGLFRSVAFGGFHRQDVLDYVEKLTKEKQEIETKLEDERQKRTKVEAHLQEAENTAHTLQESQETMTGELDYLRNELEIRSASLSQAEEERKVLLAQMETLRPGAESWERIKTQAGNIEISAHERAQVTIQQARHQAEEIQAESVQMVQDIQSDCDQLQSDLKVSLRAAEKELDAARLAFRRAEESMEGYRASLAQLLAGMEENALEAEDRP